MYGDEQDERDGDRDAGDDGVAGLNRQGFERGLQDADECGHADQPKGDGAGADADLDRGYGCIEVVEAGEQAAGTRITLEGMLLDAGTTNGDKRELGRHEEAIGQHQQRDGDEPKGGTNWVLPNRRANQRERAAPGA